jgi:hypothetical protein
MNEDKDVVYSSVEHEKGPKQATTMCVRKPMTQLFFSFDSLLSIRQGT